MGQGILGITRLRHADVSDHDDRLYSGLLPSGPALARRAFRLGTTGPAGLSGSATLLVATPDNFLIKGKLLDATIPVADTIFHPFNLILTVIVIAVVSILMVLMHTKPEQG